MSSSPAVSVLLPVRNAAQTLARAVDSIIYQSLPFWELVIVDDGSTDQSPDILQKYAQGDSRIKVISQAAKGIVPALNSGVTQCRSPYIARMDADDVSHRDRLAKQYDFLEAHTAIGLTSCGVRYAGDPEANRGYAVYVDWLNSIKTPEAIALNRFVESPLPHPSVMFRIKLIDRFGGYQEGPFPEDYELWLRWMQQGVTMAKVPEELLDWYDPPDRLSRSSERYSPDAFYSCKAGYLANWLKVHNPHFPNIIIWGAGRVSRKRATLLEQHGLHISHYIDIDPKKIGSAIHNIPVIAPDEIPAAEACFVVPYVGNRNARELIREKLCSLGFVEGRHCIFAA